MQKKLLTIVHKKGGSLGSKDFVLSTDLVSDGNKNSVAVMLQQVTELFGLQKTIMAIMQDVQSLWMK